MSRRKDEGTAKPLLQLIQTSFFTLPPIQRHYVWDVKKKVSDFWKSCLEDFQDPEKEDFSIGMVIFYQEEGEDYIRYIYDGQQRIITFFLWLASMYFHLKKAYPLEQVTTELQQLKNILFFGDKLRLTLPGKDGDDLELAIGTIDNIGLPISKRDAAGSRILESKAFIDEVFTTTIIASSREEHGVATLKGLAKFLLENVVFHYNGYDNKRKAVRDFIRVNRNGKSLTTTDMAKAEIISRILLADQWEAAELWTLLEQETIEMGLGKTVSSAVGNFLVSYCRVLKIDQGISGDKLGERFVENYIKSTSQNISLKIPKDMIFTAGKLKSLVAQPHVAELLSFSKQRYVWAILMAMAVSLSNNIGMQKRICKAVVTVFNVARTMNRPKGATWRADHEVETVLNDFVRDWTQNKKSIELATSDLEQWIQDRRDGKAFSDPAKKKAQH